MPQTKGHQGNHTLPNFARSCSSSLTTSFLIVTACMKRMILPSYLHSQVGPVVANSAEPEERMLKLHGRCMGHTVGHIVGPTWTPPLSPL